MSGAEPAPPPGRGPGRRPDRTREAGIVPPPGFSDFLTRIGFGSTAVITGDTTQVDLPRGQNSGLIHAASVLGKVSGIGFTRFESADVVRHPLVQRIVEAYDSFDEDDAV